MQEEKELVLFVLIPEYADWEPALLAAGLRRGFGMWDKSYHIGVVAPTMSPVRSVGGFEVIPDYSFDTAPDCFSALILVGGTNWLGEEAQQVLPLVNKALEQKAILAAICDASVFLAINGFLNHVNHTSNNLETLKADPNTLYTGELKYLQRPSVRDGNIVTANGAGFIEFAKDVFEGLDVASIDTIKIFFDMFKKGYEIKNCKIEAPDY